MKIFHTIFIVCAAQTVALSTASAVVTTLGLWTLGENDAGAVNGGTGNSTTTGTGGGNNLNLSGPATTYTSTLTAPGSSLAMTFGGGTVYSAGTVTSLTNNVGMEIWVRPTSLDGFDFVMANGGSGNVGYGIVQIGGQWAIIHNGVLQGAVGATVQLNTWQHLAYVRSGGVSTLYVNGVATGGTITNAPTTPTTLVIGGNRIDSPPQSEKYEGQFNGQLDNARIFTFAPGAFTVADLNYPTIVPEPSTALLSGMAALALTRRRRS